MFGVESKRIGSRYDRAHHSGGADAGLHAVRHRCAAQRILDPTFVDRRSRRDGREHAGRAHQRVWLYGVHSVDSQLANAGFPRGSCVRLCRAEPL
jgi:hypothetical protein